MKLEEIRDETHQLIVNLEKKYEYQQKLLYRKGIFKLKKLLKTTTDELKIKDINKQIRFYDFQIYIIDNEVGDEITVRV